jgi:hypothetical protein
MRDRGTDHDRDQADRGERYEYRHDVQRGRQDEADRGGQLQRADGLHHAGSDLEHVTRTHVDVFVVALWQTRLCPSGAA